MCILEKLKYQYNEMFALVVIIMPCVRLEVGVWAHYGAASDEKLIKMIRFPFNSLRPSDAYMRR